MHVWIGFGRIILVESCPRSTDFNMKLCFTHALNNNAPSCSLNYRVVGIGSGDTGFPILDWLRR